MPIDYSKYPDNWLSEIRPRIMERANNTCEFDGCDFKHMEIVWSAQLFRGQSQWFRLYSDVLKVSTSAGRNCLLSPPAAKKVQVVLTIAHLDHDEDNKDVTDDRLKAACQLCHLRYDAKEKARRRKLKPHLNV